MILTVIFIVFFSLAPATAWSYFDPGFGGYLVSSMISAIVAGAAFVSASVIFFFRSVIGRRLHALKQKCPWLGWAVLALVILCGAVFLALKLLHSSSGEKSVSAGARVIDSKRMFRGDTLIHGSLIDEQGRIVKKWSHGYLGVIDRNGDYYGEDDRKETDMYDTDRTWGRYSWDDKVIWEKHFPIHHELYLSPRDTVFTFTREIHDLNGHRVYFDVILEFDKNGKELQRYSFWEHKEEYRSYHKPFGIDAPAGPSIPVLKELAKGHRSEGTYDYFHINSFVMIPPNPLENKDPAFRPGNWLISIKHGNMVVILDQDTKKVLWHAAGDEVEGGFDGQHSASMLPDGNILVFDNGLMRRFSRVLIFDPLTMKVKWQYKEPSFYSSFSGHAQALGNGNILVTDSDSRHAFELTPDKQIVWEYRDYDGKKGVGRFKDGLILNDLYRVTRYSKEMIERFRLSL